MPRLSKPIHESLHVVSDSFPRDQIEEILSEPGIFFSDGHFEYPAPLDDRHGNHLNAIFILEPIAKKERFRHWIACDILLWLKRENITFDVILAPAQPAVMAIVEDLCKLTSTRSAFWEYLPQGWFGNRLVKGEILKGDRVLAFNGLSQTGNCVGNRLPAFASSLGGDTVAAAVFAKGSGKGVVAAEERYGPKLYSSLQVDVQVETPDQCQQCRKEPKAELTAWTKMRDQ